MRITIISKVTATVHKATIGANDVPPFWLPGSYEEALSGIVSVWNGLQVITKLRQKTQGAMQTEIHVAEYNTTVVYHLHGKTGWFTVWANNEQKS